MSVKYQIKIDNKQKFINIPLTLNEAVLGQEDIIENEFVKKEVEKAINPIVDYEQVRLHPEHSGRVVDRVDYVINVMENGALATNTTLKTIGFVNDDIKYRRNNFKKSYLNLMFFDSDIPTKQNLITINTMFNRLSRFNMVSTPTDIETTETQEGDAVVRDNDGSIVRSNTTTSRTGSTRDTTTEDEPTVLSRPTSIRSNELTRTDSERLRVVEVDDLGTFEAPIVRSETDTLDSGRSNTDRHTSTNSGIAKDIGEIPFQFIVEDPIKNQRGFGEGYYIYHQMNDLPTSLYMRANYNNFKTGLTTDLVTTRTPESIENIISKLHTKYDLKIDGDTYYYELDTEYSENISYRNGKITINLFEIQVL